MLFYFFIPAALPLLLCRRRQFIALRSYLNAFLCTFRVSWNWMQFYRLLNTQKLAYLLFLSSLFSHRYWAPFISLFLVFFCFFSHIFQIINFLSICYLLISAFLVQKPKWFRLVVIVITVVHQVINTLQ